MLEFDVTTRLLTAATRALQALLERVTREGAEVTFVTYSELNNDYVKMDSVATASMGQVLDIVRETCLQNSVPDLAALVVNKATGRPGERYLASVNWELEVERVRAFDWNRIKRLDLVHRIRMLLRM